MEGRVADADERKDERKDGREREGNSSAIAVPRRRNLGRWYRWFAPRVDFREEVSRRTRNPSEFIQSEANARLTKKIVCAFRVS